MPHRSARKRIGAAQWVEVWNRFDLKVFARNFFAKASEAEHEARGYEASAEINEIHSLKSIPNNRVATFR